MGPLALRYGLDNYGTMIQKLIGKLFGDDEFRKALAKY